MPKEKHYTAAADGPLLEVLFALMPGESRTTVKALLKHRQVQLNRRATTRFDARVRLGDVITIVHGRQPEPLRSPYLRIVFEDEYLIVIDKRYGLLSMGTDTEKERSAYHILSEYVKRDDSNGLIFIVHRLDRETSGLMLFAKSERIKEAFQRNWAEAITARRYVAVTEGCPSPPEGEIDAPLAENSLYKVFVSRSGVDALTRYRTLSVSADKPPGAPRKATAGWARSARDFRQAEIAGASPTPSASRFSSKGAESGSSAAGYALLELELATGRKNQIRAHLEHIGTPIAGDKKYGAQTNPAGRVCLHACRLDFIHPVTGEQFAFSTPVPRVFEQVVGRPPGKLSEQMVGRAPGKGKSAGTPAKR